MEILDFNQNMHHLRKMPQHKISEFIITGVLDAVRIVQNNPGLYRVVSISSPNRNISQANNDKQIRDGFKNAKEVLFLEFDDMARRYSNKIKMASVEDCENALNFLSKGGKLLVHCQAGISRSTAISLGFLLTQYDNYQEAVVRLFKIRPQASPNDYIVKLMCKILDKDYYSISQFIDDCIVAGIDKFSDFNSIKFKY